VLDLLGLEVEEAATARNAGVVDEQADRWMPLAHDPGDAFDVGAIGDVADLVFGADLARDLG
jgi:hypothetical protein